jgi:hypothetical protein
MFDEALGNAIDEGRCPDCGATDGFLRGPRGGMSVNIFCASCRAGFNYTVFGAHRIEAQPEGVTYPRWDPGQEPGAINWYILDDNHTPQHVGADAVGLRRFARWAAQDEETRRHVAYEDVGDAEVSTIFLGFDHRRPWHQTSGPPLLFEVMIFGGPHDKFQDRCSTWDEALAMHALAVERAKGGLH